MGRPDTISARWHDSGFPTGFNGAFGEALAKRKRAPASLLLGTKIYYQSCKCGFEKYLPWEGGVE